MNEALLAAIAVSLISLVGVATLAFGAARLQSISEALVSLAAGTLLGGAAFHLLPEAFALGEHMHVSIALLAGIIIFYAMESFLNWHHHHEADPDHHTAPVGVQVLVADFVHNFIDGVVIAVAFSAGPEVGIAATLAVILHEIPQELGDFGLLVHAGYSAKKALLFNLLSALSAVLGVLFVAAFGDGVSEYLPLLMAAAAGGFFYIALSDVVPELHRSVAAKQKLTAFVLLLIGVLLTFALAVTHSHEHDHDHGHERDQEHVEQMGLVNGL